MTELSQEEQALFNDLILSQHIPEEYIIKVVCDAYRISKWQLIRQDRRKNIVFIRKVVMYLLRTFTTLSYPDIGRRFHRHHTTVMHNCETLYDDIKDLKTLEHFYCVYEEIKEHVNAERT